VKISYGAKALIVLAFLASLLSFTKFDHCYNKNWATPDVYTHACYTDISALYGARGLVDHLWPYTSATNAVEYPPITGVVMWATALVTPRGANTYHYYFLVNAFLLALLFIVTAFVVAKINPQAWYLFPILPAVLASLYINWDMWAVVTALASIYFFDKKRYGPSALLLGISIATKFFPIVLLAPIAIIFFRRREIASAIKYLGLSLGVAIAINAPFAIATPHGWWRFFALNGSRGVDFGSLWYALQLLGLTISSANIAAVLLFLVGIAGFSLFLLRVEGTPTLAEIAFIAVAIFTIASKVYSPQYVLWLAPLGVIALTPRSMSSLRPAFWIWQGTELIYHLAIWEYLASYSGTRFGLPATPYAIATLLRIVACGYFALKIGQNAKNAHVLSDMASEPELSTTEPLPTEG
jgi:uncharacterized membrane protein